jgi:PTS system nitrogen regulatory IIA component
MMWAAYSMCTSNKMNIKDFLAPSDVLIDIPATDKVALLNDLAQRAASALHLSPYAVASEIEKRDRLGSTGIGGGVSIPHARFREVKKAFGLLVRLKQAIEFDAVDGQPVDIVFLLVLPAASQLDQLNALAAVARKLRDRTVLNNLRLATTASALYRAVTE